MKKVERWREKKVRESKVDVEKCVDFYWKGKWLYYYEMYQNGKTTLLLWNGGSTFVDICNKTCILIVILTNVYPYSMHQFTNYSNTRI